MIYELQRFAKSIFLIVVTFILVGRILQRLTKFKSTSLIETSMEVFDAFIGNQNYDEFTFPTGVIYLTFTAYVSQMLLIRFLVAMFISKYKKVFKNQDFLNRLTIISLKNSSSYDKRIGAITTSFFPINIILLPFIAPILYFKNDRFNDFILKAQYFVLLGLYSLVAFVMALVLMPIIYLKSVINAAYIVKATKR